MNVHIVGASSEIAKFLYFRIKSEKNVECIYLYSSKPNIVYIDQSIHNYSNIINNFTDGDIILYLAHLRESVDNNLNFLKKILFNLKGFYIKQFIYISSMNAKVPNSSKYSNSKYVVEEYLKKIILSFEKLTILRLGIIKSVPPFTAYKSLNFIFSFPIKFTIKDNYYNYITHLNDIELLDIFNIEGIQEIYTNKIILMEYFNSKKYYLVKINLDILLRLFKLVSSKYNESSVVQKLLTFCGHH